MVDLNFQINAFERALITMNQEQAEQIIREAMESGSPVKIASELVSQALQRIGDSWEEGKVALSQVYMSGVICEEIIDKILPPSDPHRRNQPKTAIAVFEDHHLLGKRIIYSSLRASGFELMDLGGGLHADELVEMVKKFEIKILLLSVLMLPSALRIRELKKKLADIDAKIVVGGAPFRYDSQLWKEVGADGCGKDSFEAIEIITKMTREINESN